MIYDKQETYPDTPPDTSNGFRVMPCPFFILLFIVYLPYQIKGCRRFLLVFHGGGLTMQKKPGRGRHCDLYKPVWCNGNTPGFDPVVISSNLIIGARL